jgi:hypothetical protein
LREYEDLNRNKTFGLGGFAALVAQCPLRFDEYLR